MPKQTPKRSKKTTTKKTVKKLPKNTPKIDPKSGETGGGAEIPETPQKTEKNGNKSQYANKVEPYLADIARYTRCGLTEGQLCEYYNVGKTQWTHYKKKYPELNETLFKARQQFKADLVNRAYEVAMGMNTRKQARSRIATQTATLQAPKRRSINVPPAPTAI